ncbi:MAG: hypothetical protein LBD73_08215 [Deferribacteraceae bacterium]|nr:hypothetical protein [Deferribacteraceae bacterium]
MRNNIKEFHKRWRKSVIIFLQTLEAKNVQAVGKLYFNGLPNTEIAECLDLLLEKVVEIIGSLTQWSFCQRCLKADNILNAYLTLGGIKHYLGVYFAGT